LLLFFPISKNDNSYFGCIIDKNKLINNSHLKQSLIIVGGSNIAFGLDCKKMSLLYSKPVINYGIQGGLGVVFQLEYLKNRVNKGDTIILIPEYDQYLGDNIYGSGKALSKALILSGVSNFSLLNPHQFRKVLPFLFNSSLENVKLNIYKDLNLERFGFNEFGDFIAHLDLPNRQIDVFDKYSSKLAFNRESIRKIEEFSQYFKKKGVGFLISYCPYPKSLYELHQKKIQVISLNIVKSNLKILGRSQDYVFPDSLFFEYPLHLNKTGREIRTNLLIKQINSFN
jgi:hypothetical protein